MTRKELEEIDGIYYIRRSTRNLKIMEKKIVDKIKDFYIINGIKEISSE